MKIIGRKAEREALEGIYNAEGSKFVAVYGRRRVGKTFLVKEHFAGRLAFWHTGLSPYERSKEFLLRDQLQAFYYSLQDFGLQDAPCPRSWLEAFRLLEQLLQSRNDGSRQVVFIDEMPWMDTARSRFIPAFEHFWNGWAARRDNVMLIVCGSATSWIQNNLINNKGGLYNRVTHEIKLRPFTLAECDEFFESRGIMMSHYDIAQTYMVFGGVPHYLELFEKGLSVAQNIDRLLFAPNGQLRNEFNRLFTSLFINAEQHIAVVQQLANNRCGYTRSEILQATGIKDGGGASLVLKALVESDFISAYKPFGEKRIERYRLIDPFCLFFLRFASRLAAPDPAFWEKNHNSPQLNAWRGYAFEELCFSHMVQIKRALGVLAVSSQQSSWVVESVDKGRMQIDLLIDRSDNVVNLCEIKFYSGPFAISRQYDDVLRQRVQALIEQLPRRKTVHLTLIAAYGIKPNGYNGQVQSTVTLDDLFQ
ncbi:MAG: ATP-binding protein [Muribaculaceae bacterium]|nr:ATP-binding protein [Muribaculaceae bacterium]